MLDIRRLRNEGEQIRAALARREHELDLGAFAELDALRRDADMRSQELQSARKKASKKVGELVKSGTPVEQAKEEVAETLREIDAELDRQLEQARRAQEQIREFLMATPNVPDPEVPDGRDEDDNQELRRHGEPPRFDFTVRDHVELGAALNGGLDFDRAAKLSGARFAVMGGAVAGLHRALINFMLSMHTGRHGYEEVYVPYLVGADALRGTGQLPKFGEDLFRVEGERELYLIPTAEVPVTNLFADEIIEDQHLPLKKVCHTPCFRSEAGSHGKDTRGMIRQHQFEKVELVQLVRPAESDQALEALTGHAEAVLQALELPYRVVRLCTGDLGFSAACTLDLEVWLPSQQRYREISSCSNFRDFQARRMQARWRNPETGKPEPLHTLNGSGVAAGRALVAILENYQNEDGSVTIPEVLRPWMGGVERIGVQ